MTLNLYFKITPFHYLTLNIAETVRGTDTAAMKYSQGLIYALLISNDLK